MSFKIWLASANDKLGSSILLISLSACSERTLLMGRNFRDGAVKYFDKIRRFGVLSKVSERLKVVESIFN